MHYKKIFKIGSSLAVIIPAPWTKQMKLRMGDYIDMTMPEIDRILITKVDQKYAREISNLVIHVGNGDLSNGTPAENSD